MLSSAIKRLRGEQAPLETKAFETAASLRRPGEKKDDCSCKGKSDGADPSEARGAFNRFFRGFEEFKSRNDERLAKLEKNRKSDPLDDDQVDRLNTDLTKLYREVKKLQPAKPQERKQFVAPEPGDLYEEGALISHCPGVFPDATYMGDESAGPNGQPLYFVPYRSLCRECPTAAVSDGIDCGMHSDDGAPNEQMSRLMQLEQRGLRGRRIDYGRFPPLEAGEHKGMNQRGREKKAAFQNYLRTGDESAIRRFDQMERKALSVGTDTDGGYTSVPELDREISRKVSEVSPIRQIAQVREISTSMLKKLWNPGGTSSGWVGETTSRPETNTAQLDELQFPTMELYAMPAATQSILDDSFLDIEDWLAGEVQIEFAEQEGAAFVNGNGVSRPKGYLQTNKVENASWTDGYLGYIVSGNASGFASSDPSDALLDLIYAPKQAYRQNAQFVMNRATVAACRKFKDGEGNYLWQPGIKDGQPQSLLGYGITEAEDMPDIGAGNYPIAFGDFMRGYLIVDRIGLRVLRDPYSSKPHVLFYTTKRVGGGVQNFEALKLFKIGTS